MQINSGESVSLACENKLLELTGYYGAQQSDDGSESVSNEEACPVMTGNFGFEIRHINFICLVQ
jgi:hypothetical protein